MFFLNKPSMPLVRPETDLDFCSIILATSMDTSLRSGVWVGRRGEVRGRGRGGAVIQNLKISSAARAVRGETIEEECTDGGGSCPTLVTHPTEMPCLAMV